MEKRKKYLCVIPARAGSKGIKNKNYIKINGVPLIQHTINTAINLKNYCDIVISSDSKKIKKICKKNNIDFFGLRPKYLSQDSSKTYDVVKYELKKIEKIKKIKYEGILLFQPTCPVRNLNKIKKAFKIIKNNKYDSLVSVSSVEGFHPVRMKKFNKNYLVNYLDSKKENMNPRQSLPKVYIRSGAIYMIKRYAFLKYKALVGRKCYGMILEGLETTNIDTIEDLSLLKLKNKFF